jgi:hypothetical protein
VVTVRVVKGRQYSAYMYTVPHAGASIAEMESVRPTLDLDSDSFDIGTNSFQ